MSDRQDRFEYSYSAPTEEERREIQYIMKSYQPKEKTRGKLEELRALDAKVKRLPLVLALTLGIAGCLILGGGMAMALILGCGMCMAMEVIGGGIALGVIIGMAGIAVVSANYPIYSAMLSSRKSKYADEIMSMGREITGGEN